MIKRLLTVADINRKELDDMMSLSAKLKAERGKNEYKPLAGKSIAMIFAKSSTRTRVSFDIGIVELGGYPLYLETGKMQVGRGETIGDTAKVMGRYVHGIVIRTYDHSDVEGLACHSGVPVINALTDDFHPCQALTDLFTMREAVGGKLDGVKLAYVGDGSCNMANSLILASKLAGVELTIGAPEQFAPNKAIMKRKLGTGTVRWETDPYKAVADADFIYTDVWVSMGCEDEAEERFKILKPFQVNMDLVKAAAPGVKILHCLPAHRNEEITDEVMDSERSIVFDQAENRLHVQKAILSMMFDPQA
jgi:ornithine carbamoyltransferase